MKRSAIYLAILCLLAVGMAHVAATQQAINLTGKWDVVVRMPSGKVTEQWTLTQDKGKITGTVKGPNGESTLTGEVSDVNFRADVGTGAKEYKVLATIDVDTKADMDGAARMGQNEYLWSAKKSK